MTRKEHNLKIRTMKRLLAHSKVRQDAAAATDKDIVKAARARLDQIEPAITKLQKALRKPGVDQRGVAAYFELCQDRVKCQRLIGTITNGGWQ